METSSGIPVERTMRPYIIGIVAALILTAIPFALVFTGSLPRETTLVIIAAFAVVQILVHLRFFLHIDLESTPRENLVALAFACVIIFLMVGGSLWIMFDLYHRMMV
jgi:cytochrome o ubiquinol oxidase operon protein cyoD